MIRLSTNEEIKIVDIIYDMIVKDNPEYGTDEFYSWIIENISVMLEDLYNNTNY